jgi:hypothetical protein
MTSLQLQAYNYKLTITSLQLQVYNYKFTTTSLTWSLEIEGDQLASSIPKNLKTEKNRVSDILKPDA